MARRRSPPVGAEAPTPPGRSFRRSRDSGRALPYAARQRGGRRTSSAIMQADKEGCPTAGYGVVGDKGLRKPLSPAASPRRRPKSNAWTKPPSCNEKRREPKAATGPPTPPGRSSCALRGVEKACTPKRTRRQGQRARSIQQPAANPGMPYDLQARSESIGVDWSPLPCACERTTCLPMPSISPYRRKRGMARRRSPPRRGGSSDAARTLVPAKPGQREGVALCRATGRRQEDDLCNHADRQGGLSQRGVRGCRGQGAAQAPVPCRLAAQATTPGCQAEAAGQRHKSPRAGLKPQPNDTKQIAGPKPQAGAKNIREKTVVFRTCPSRQTLGNIPCRKHGGTATQERGRSGREGKSA